MNQVGVFIRLAKMRRTAGAGRLESVMWAGGILWRATKGQK